MSSYSYSNGASQASLADDDAKPIVLNRFTNVPPSIDIPIQEAEDEEETSVEVDLNGLPDDPTELCVLLDNENSEKNFWMSIALGYAKHGKTDGAIEMLLKGKESERMQRDVNERLPLLGALVWLYLMKARASARNTGGSGEPQCHISMVVVIHMLILLDR